MNEENQPKRPDNSPAARARRAQKRKRQRQRQRMYRIFFVCMLALVIVLSCLVAVTLTNRSDHKDQTEPSASTFSSESNATEEPEISWEIDLSNWQFTAQQYFVYSCDSGSFLNISGNLGDRIYPASITKLFTAYVALQYLQPQNTVTAGDVLDLVYPGSSVAEIQKGDVLTVDMLVGAMLLPSGNDAAYILAAEAGRVIDGNPDESAQTAVNSFVAKMNQQAKDLGMNGTHFANPDGIHSDSHYTTFADLAIMGKLALDNTTIMKYAGTGKMTAVFESGTQKEWKNTNSLIDPDSEFYCPYAIGLKTGQTPYAGSCLLSAFDYNGQKLIVGVFGCPEVDDRFGDTLSLFIKAAGINP